MSRSLLAVLCTVLVFTLAVPAAATTARHLSDEALVAEADLIVVGDTLSVATTWVDRDLVTVATVRVQDSLKGGVGDTVQVVLPGGVDTSGPVPVAVTWPGAPTLIQGEQAVLFLNDYQPIDGSFAVSGWSQGKFTVVDGEQGPRVQRDLSSLTLASGQSRARGQARTESKSEFVEKIRGMVARRGVQ